MSIAIGYIPTDDGDRVLAEGIARAKREGTPLTLINIRCEDNLDDARCTDEGELRAALERAQHTGVDATAVHGTCESGAGFLDAFFHALESVKPDLLIIGMRRDPDIPQHMLGNTMQAIVADSPCSVLVV